MDSLNFWGNSLWRAASIASSYLPFGLGELTTTSQNKFGLFLSHSWENKAFVETFKANVEAKGVRCWIDKEKIVGGDALHDEIQKGLGDSQVFVAFISESYVRSDNCNMEFSLAVDWKKPIIPVKLTNGQWPPKGKVATGLAGKLYLDGTKNIIDDKILDETLKSYGLIMLTSTTDINHEDDAKLSQRTAKEVAAVKRKTEEEAEAARRRAEDEAAVKRKTEAAVKRKADEEAATKNREEKEARRNEEVGRIPEVLPMDPVKLVRFLTMSRVRNDVNEIRRVVGMLRPMLVNDSGRQGCIDAGAPQVLTELASERVVIENWKAVREIAASLDSISLTQAGITACILTNTPSVLTALGRERAVRENGEAAKWVAGAIWNIAMTDRGRQACIRAGAPQVLKSLASEMAIKDDEDAKLWVREACESLKHDLREHNQRLRRYKARQSSQLWV